MIKKIGKYWIPILLAVVFSLIFASTQLIKTDEPIDIGVTLPDSQWFVIDKFQGYQTRDDATKINNGANPQGQNTTANNGDRVSIRKLGYDLFPDGTASSTAGPITSIHTFRKRDGTNIMMRSYLTFLEYYDEANDTWEYLKTGLTTGESFGYADYNINTDLVSYVYFGNQTDNAMRWNGAISPLATAIVSGASTITVDDSTSFLSSGTLIYCGTTTAYASVDDDTGIFTLSASTSITCAVDEAVANLPAELSTLPKGNIYLAANNRIFIAGIASTSQAVYFSEYGDATTFTSASLVVDGTDTSPGIFNLGMGGGAVTGMALDENSIYIFKQSAVWKATLDDTTYTLTNLKPFDGKGQTVGSLSSKAVFTGNNTVYFITPDNQIMELARVESVDYPQITPISNIIQPTVDDFNFDSASGIVFRNKAYFAVKSNNDIAFNNTVLVWNIKQKIWDSPIVGWNISDFVVYDDTDTEELYMGDAVTPNIYKVNNTAQDGNFGVTANWRTKQIDFGLPHVQKQLSDIFIEGYISESTTITVSLLIDEDGYSEIFSHEINGTDDDIIYDSTAYNAFGLSAFGTYRFGSQEEASGLKKFRVYLGSDFRPMPFYNVQLEVASDEEAQEWEVINIGFEWKQYSQPKNRKLFQSFK